MKNFYEIDFLEVSPRSGDAITIRYSRDNIISIHVVDAGFQKDGEMVVEHIKKYYNDPKFVDHVVATHNDRDHCGGLKEVLKYFEIGSLWMLRPWIYAEHLLPFFRNYNSSDRLASKLRDTYSNLAVLEEICLTKGVMICEPFFGKNIGEFKVLSPSFDLFGEMVLESEKTPPHVEANSVSIIHSSLKGVVNWVKAEWGQEHFPENGTSCENEMSIVQWANFNGIDIILTGDAGRKALTDVVANSGYAGLKLPLHDGSKIQVPHHGSRRNVSTNLLDDLLGTRLPTRISSENTKVSAYVCAAGKDKEHPKNAVVRGFMHRGAKVITTKNCRCIWTHSSNAPARAGFSDAIPESYPEVFEED